MLKIWVICFITAYHYYLFLIERYSFYSNSCDSDFINDYNNIIGSDDEFQSNNFNYNKNEVNIKA